MTTIHSDDGIQGILLQEGGAAILENAFDLLAVVELPELRLRWVNRSGRSLLHIGPHQPVRDLPWSDYVSAETTQVLRRHALRALNASHIWRGAGALRTTQGNDIRVRLTALRAPSGPGAASLALISAIDDTQFCNMQAVLRSEQVLLHALLGTLPDAIYFKDRESRFLRVNAALAAKLGVQGPECLIGQTDGNYFAAEHATQARADEKHIIDTGEALLDAEEKETWLDGRVTWAASSKFPLRDWRGQLVGTFGISRDITARKQAEAERQRSESERFRAQKMESIGRLAAGIAHEINTPTQYIADNTHFLVGAFAHMARVVTAYRSLRDRAGEHHDLHPARQAVAAAETEAELDYLLDEIPRTLEQTIDGISRVGRIVRSLREFSHPNPPEKRPANLNHAIQTAIAVSRHEWKLVADVETDLDPDLPSIPCVLDEFNQVILNLIVNAAHAIEEAIADRPGERGRIALRTRRDGEWAVVEIEDTGTGIAEPVRQHIFEPFFTTKPLGKGTGQGLALVHTMVVKNHQGAVEFTSETGRGTTFRLRFPTHPPPLVRECPLPADMPTFPTLAP